MDETRIKKIVDTTLSLPSDQRDTYLDQACGDDTQLRTEVTRFLSNPLDQRDPSFASFEFGPGDTIGPYTIVEELGAGGMGTVFLAEQSQPVSRQVALKVVKLGMDTRDVLARFETERKTLGLMNHPNVASVLDAGATDSGRPYFVMEYVPGLPINEFCDQARLRISERLNLLLQTCEGVVHAHQKGVIHRDLKPNNILVTDHSGSPLVKIIDFGVAKSTEQKFGETLTAVGAFIGTPHYTAPEQAGLGEMDVDTRADVYSLGVVLYELLVGQLPFDRHTFNNKSFEEICRVLREVDPPTPSARLSQSGLPGRLANLRNVDIGHLKRRLKGDLSWIVMKAMHKDRDQRYQTVSALADDLQRFLARHPVSARPPRASYRARRFVQRHKVLVSGLMGIVLALSLGLVQTLLARAEAEREAALAAATTSLLTHILSTADPWNQDSRSDITVLSVIRDLDQRLNSGEVGALTPELSRLGELGLEEDLRRVLRQVIAEVYLSLDEDESAVRNAEQALTLAKRSLGPGSVDAIKAVTAQARGLARQGEPERAVQLLEPILNAVDVEEATPAQLRATVHLLDALHQASTRYDNEAALSWAEAALSLSELRLGPEHETTVEMGLNLCSELIYAGDFDRAMALARQTIERARLISDHKPALEIRAMQRLAAAMAWNAQIADAAQTGERAVDLARHRFGDGHLETAGALRELATVLKLVGRYPAALEAATEAQRRFLNAIGEDSRVLRHIDSDLIDIRLTLADYEQAEELARNLLARQEAMNDLTGASATRFRLAQVLNASGNSGEALRLAEQVLESETKQGMSGWNLALDRSLVAEAHAELGQLDQAESMAGAVLQQYEDFTQARMVLAKVAAEREDWGQVIRNMDIAIEQDLDFGGEGYPDVSVYRLLRTEALLHQGELKSAHELAALAVSVLEEAYGDNHWQVSRGRLLMELSRPDPDPDRIDQFIAPVIDYQGRHSLDGRRSLKLVIDHFQDAADRPRLRRYQEILAGR